MPNLSRVNRQPLYQQVRQILLTTIQSGEWGPGEKIPIEPVLAQQLGVSIGTLRRAVETLVNDGVLLRREGVGLLFVLIGMPAIGTFFKSIATWMVVKEGIFANSLRLN